MALVQAVNGFGMTVDRSVARPYMYGRGMISVDPAYSPYLGGVFQPVRVSYQGNDLGVDTPSDTVRERTAEALSHGGTAPLPGPDRTEYEKEQAKGASLVPSERGRNLGINAERASGNTEVDQYRGTPDPFLPAGGWGTPLSGPNTTGRPATRTAPGVIRPAPNDPQRNTGLVGRPPYAATPGGLKNLPKNVKSSLGPVQWMMDSSYMETIRDAAVKQYVSKNNEWANGKGVPLGIGGESKYKGITKERQLASMFQVVPSKYTGPRPATPAGLSPGHPAYDRATRGTLTQYDVYAPAFTHANAVNSYYDMGLWRNPAEVLNWKRTFNALGYYDTNARPNISSTGWGKFENDAMAKFMADANGNPQAAQSVADLPKVRDDLLAQAAEMEKSQGGGAGGGSGAFSQTQTTTNVQLSNLEDARETLRGQITNMIGRFPTDAEVRQFLGKLNDYERANPTTTTTKTSSPDGSNITQTVSGSRGDNIDPFHIAEQYAKQNTPGDYHAYQQLKYYQALSDIIGNPQGTQSIPQGG